LNSSHVNIDEVYSESEEENQKYIKVNELLNAEVYTLTAKLADTVKK